MGCAVPVEGGADVGVTVVLMVVVVPGVPVCGLVPGTGWGGGTVAGAGIPEGDCDPVAGAELGGGTAETGGCGGTVDWGLELWAPAQALSSKKTKIRRRKT